MAVDRSALGAFLRSRRDRLDPEQVGVEVVTGPRRVPGLRKEEVALIAGMSSDHYSRLEQGRQHNVTDEMVNALCKALQLDEIEAAHLRNLAAPTATRRRTTSDPSPRADPGMLRLMDALDHLPTLLLGRRSEVLASNRLLREVLGWEAAPGMSFMRWLFLDPTARRRMTNWADFASAAIGSLRYEAGRHPDDQQLADLIDELRGRDQDVGRWWNDHGVTFRTSLEKLLMHPVAGPLSFTIESVSRTQGPDQQLVVYTVEPDSPTARALPLLDTRSRAAAHTPD